MNELDIVISRLVVAAKAVAGRRYSAQARYSPPCKATLAKDRLRQAIEDYEEAAAEIAANEGTWRRT